MYLEKIQFCDDFAEDLWTNNMDEGIQVVGGRDSFKLNAIYQLLEKLNPEFSEIFVLSVDIEQEQFWNSKGIPIASDLDRIASALRQLVREFRERQRPFRIFVGHPITCIIELDDLHRALAERAVSLGIEYDDRELNEVVVELRDTGSKVGISIVACTEAVPFWNHSLFLGERAIKFAEVSSLLSQEVFEEVANQPYPCYFTIADDIYLMSVTDRLTALEPRKIVQIPESKRVIDV